MSSSRNVDSEGLSLCTTFLNTSFSRFLYYVKASYVLLDESIKKYKAVDYMHNKIYTI